MASAASSSTVIVMFVVVFILLTGNSSAKLSTTFYSKSCPRLLNIVKSGVRAAVAKEKRMGASLLRLFFHDCFVQGCDGSILLDDTPSFRGEQTALPNNNSARGYNIIDNIKTKVEKVCPSIVSCADILAIAARDSTLLLGGPSWEVKLGRRDSRTASFARANDGRLPLATSSLGNLINRFKVVGLSTKDMVALSGSHTIGQASCVTFRTRIYNESNIDASFAKVRQGRCPRNRGSGDSNLVPLDPKTPNFFENNYYKNLINKKGLLHSDQVLYNGGSTDYLVKIYSKKPSKFKYDFAVAMIKMGDISPLTGSKGEIRKKCGRVN